MREIGRSLHRFPATAFLAGAALLAGLAEPAQAKPKGDDESALAIPRIGGAGQDGGVALPQPLAPSEASRIRRIFELQRRGAIAEASRLTEQVDATTPLVAGMLGTLLAERYLGRYLRPGPDELRAWLARWSDLPAATAIHSLLASRLPSGANSPEPPSTRSLPSARVDVPAPPVPEETGVAERLLARNADLDRSVAAATRARGAAGVERLLAHTKGLSREYEAQLRGEAARILFTMNRDADALAVATRGARCHREAGPACRTAALAGLMGGLAAWRQGHGDQARPLFEAAWDAPVTTPSLRAAAAFWAARANLARSRETGRRSPWLARAAAERLTFYGLIARRILRDGRGGDRNGADDDREVLTEADIDAIAALPAGLRAFALLQAGQRDLAEAEFRLLWPTVSDTPALARAVMLVADRAGSSGLTAQLAELLQSIDGRPRVSQRFHVPRLRPDGGFQIDPAMVYALARTESNFDANMVSSAGARGMMQIMPETASFVRGGFAPAGNGRAGRIRGPLDDPSVNLALGQSYVAYLAGQDGIDGDLIRLLASYNAGPSAFARWSAEMRSQGDPLLFLEAIPIDETRAFVPRVLAYTWIYATRLRLPAPSLDELAAGEWPRYHDLRDQAGGVIRPH